MRGMSRFLRATRLAAACRRRSGGDRGRRGRHGRAGRVDQDGHAARHEGFRDRPGAELHGRPTSRAADERLAHERRLDDERALLAAGHRSTLERVAAEGRLAHAPARAGVGAKYSGESQPVVYKGVDLRTTGEDDASPSRSRRARSSGSTAANLDQKITHGLLRLAEPRRRDRRRPHLLSASSTASSSRSTRRPARSSGRSSRASGSSARRSRRRRSTWTATSTSASSAREFGTRGLPRGDRRRDRQAGLALLHDRRARASRAATPGRRHEASTCAAARRSGRRRPSIRSSASSTSRPATPAPTGSAATARQEPLRRLDRRARHEDRQDQVVLPGGPPRHLGLRRPEPGRPVRRSAGSRCRHRAAGKTGWLYMLDRATGKPLYGIAEKPVPQNADAEDAGRRSRSRATRRSSRTEPAPPGHRADQEGGDRAAQGSTRSRSRSRCSRRRRPARC